MPGALADGGEARVVVHQARLADHLEELAPLLVVVDQHADVAVPGAVRAAVVVEDARIAARADGRVEGQAAHVVAQHELRHGLEHRHVDGLACAGALAVEQSCRHGIGRGERDDAIGDGARRIARHVGTCAPGERGNGHGALDQVVIGGLGGVRAALAIAVDTDVQDARVDLGDLFVAEVQACHGLRAHVVDQHIGIGGEAQQRFAPGGLLQVQHDAALAAIDVQEDAGHAVVAAGAHITHGVAGGRLDLDHVGAEVAEDLGGVRSHQDGGHVDDADPLQGARRYRVPPVLLCCRCHVVSSENLFEVMLRGRKIAEKYFRYVVRYIGCIGGASHGNAPRRGRDQKICRTPVVTPIMFFCPGACG
ncbi:hypothetical protein D3C81_959840 [compost metagenome]